jgi:hypothetical protein
MSNRFKIYVVKFVIASAFLFVFNFAKAQTLEASINKKEILIGEQITYNLKIDLPSKNYLIELRIPDSIPHFDVIEKTIFDTSTNDGKYSWQQKIVFTSFDSGSYMFPSFSYQIKNLGKASQNLFTDSFKVNVGYMPMDTTLRPRDIKTVMAVDYFDWFWIIVAAAALLFLVIVFLLVKYLRKQKSKLPILNNANAYKEAMQALELLKKANEAGTMQVKEYHTKLAGVLKTYYSKAVRQNILNNTTDEVLAKLKLHQINAETASQASQALLTGDASKFAKYHPSFNENELALNYLKNTIDEIEKSLHTKTT